MAAEEGGQALRSGRVLDQPNTLEQNERQTEDDAGDARMDELAEYMVGVGVPEAYANTYAAMMRVAGCTNVEMLVQASNAEFLETLKDAAGQPFMLPFHRMAIVAHVGRHERDQGTNVTPAAVAAAVVAAAGTGLSVKREHKVKVEITDIPDLEGMTTTKGDEAMRGFFHATTVVVQSAFEHSQKIVEGIERIRSGKGLPDPADVDPVAQQLLSGALDTMEDRILGAHYVSTTPEAMKQVLEMHKAKGSGLRILAALVDKYGPPQVEELKNVIYQVQEMLASPPATVEQGIKWMRKMKMHQDKMKEMQQPYGQVQRYMQVEAGMTRIKTIKEAVEREQQNPEHDPEDGDAITVLVERLLKIEARRLKGKTAGYSAGVTQGAPAETPGVVGGVALPQPLSKTDAKKEKALAAAKKDYADLKKAKEADKRSHEAKEKKWKEDSKKKEAAPPTKDQDEMVEGVVSALFSRLTGVATLYCILAKNLTHQPCRQEAPESETAMSAAGDTPDTGLEIGGDPEKILDLGASCDIIGAPHLEEARDEGPARANLETANETVQVDRKCSIGPENGQPGLAMKGLAVASSAMSLVSTVPRLAAGWVFWAWNQRAGLEDPEGNTHVFELEEGLYRYKGERLQGRRATQRKARAAQKQAEARGWFGCLGSTTRSGSVYQSDRPEEEASEESDQHEEEAENNNGPGTREEGAEEGTPKSQTAAQDARLQQKKDKPTHAERREAQAKGKKRSQVAQKQLQKWLATALLLALIVPPMAAMGEEALPGAAWVAPMLQGLLTGKVGAPEAKTKKSKPRAATPEETMAQHQSAGHQPFRGDCLHCTMARIRARAARRRPLSAKVEGADKGYVMGLDVLGPMPCKDTEQNEYVLVGVEVGHTDYAFTRGMKDKSAASVKAAIVSMRTELAAKSQVNRRLVRVHSDRGPEFERDVENYLLQDNIEQTDTGGYRAQGNSRTERMIGTTSEVARTNIWQATGGESEYDPLWGAAVTHATDRINRSVRGVDGKCPHEELTGETVDREEDVRQYYPFGCHVVQHRPKQHRESKLSTPGATGIWVGKSTMVKGADRVMQITWDGAQGKWRLGKVVDADHVKCDSGSFPLKEGSEALEGAQKPTKQAAKTFRDKYNLMRYSVGADPKEWQGTPR